jgi:hypothetical protein
MTLQKCLPDDQGTKELSLLLQVILGLGLCTACAEIPGEQGLAFLVQVGFCQDQPDFLRRFRG